MIILSVIHFQPKICLEQKLYAHRLCVHCIHCPVILQTLQTKKAQKVTMEAYFYPRFLPYTVIITASLIIMIQYLKIMSCYLTIMRSQLIIMTCYLIILRSCLKFEIRHNYHSVPHSYLHVVVAARYNYEILSYKQ